MEDSATTGSANDFCTIAAVAALLGIIDGAVCIHMGMPPHQLLTDSACNIVKPITSRLLGEFAVDNPAPARGVVVEASGRMQLRYATIAGNGTGLDASEVDRRIRDAVDEAWRGAG